LKKQQFGEMRQARGRAGINHIYHRRNHSVEEDLTILRELMATGKVTPVIDRRYRLSEASEAIRYLEEGHARGKVVIVLESWANDAGRN
jgi:NADPH:quinone reductase-like Zn-dependent oxidoreductase